MEKSLLLTALVSLSFGAYAAEGHFGPLGDQWEKYQIIRVNEQLDMKSALVIKTDKLILGADIITNGHKLDIEAREIEIQNNAKVMGFSAPYVRILTVPNGPGNMGTPGTYPGGNGGTGPDGDPGIDGLPGVLTPAPITIKVLKVEGSLYVNGDGQQGGRGGKGAPGGKGGKGGNGMHGWASIGASCDGNGRPGTSGGNGGAGGLGGKGGRGGDGGANISIELLLPSTTYSYQSLPGRPGKGGERGNLGESGDVGKGGNGAYDEYKNLIYKCGHSEPAGSDGIKIQRTESSNSIKMRTGDDGKEYSGSLNPTYDQEVNSLFGQKDSVLSETYSFHFARLYKTLVQDSFRVAAHQELTRTQIENITETVASILLSANQKILDDLIAGWSRQFIVKTQNLDEFNLYRRHAEQVVTILKELRAGNKNASTLKAEVTKLLADADKLLQLKVRNLTAQCFKLNEMILERPLAHEFSLIHAPLCREEVVRNLLRNPKQTMTVNVKRTKGIHSDTGFTGISIEEKEVNQERRIAQAANIIILYNKSYTEADIRRAIPVAKDGTQLGSMLAYNLPSEDKVTAENIRVHIQVLGLGAVLK